MKYGFGFRVEIWLKIKGDFEEEIDGKLKIGVGVVEERGVWKGFWTFSYG